MKLLLLLILTKG